MIVLFGSFLQDFPHMNRPPYIHVVIMDGTLSTLAEKGESNAGLTYKLLGELPVSKHLSLTYEEGIQWCTWRSAIDVIAGIGINRQIRRVYGALASRYRPGDKIFFLGSPEGPMRCALWQGSLIRSVC